MKNKPRVEVQCEGDSLLNTASVLTMKLNRKCKGIMILNTWDASHLKFVNRSFLCFLKTKITNFYLPAHHQ